MGGNRPRKFGGVNAYKKLQFGTFGKIVYRLEEPLNHAWESVGGVMELGVPDNVGEQADAGLGKVYAHLVFDGLEVGIRSAVEPYPVVGAVPAAFKIIRQFRFHLLVPGDIFPLGNGFLQQRVMIGIIMAENETLFPVGGVPVNDSDLLAAADLTDDALGHVYTVVKHRTIKFKAL